jgi:RNA polymerase sigma factor (sigma-70 family)
MIEDVELLRRFVDDHSQDAFAELVRRRVNLVYSVALRQVGGDAHLAEDVTQRVFADLARKAKQLVNHAVLSGWLYRSAQFAATDVVRSERRRRGREQEAVTMNETSSNPEVEADWEKLRPVLDQAMGELEDDDRDAVALRFFEQHSYGEIGATLQLTEDAARKRVTRALDKLHAVLARRGITSTTAALGIGLAGQATIAAPTGLAATITGAALGGTTASSLGWLATFMSMSKLQVGIVGGLAVAATLGYFRQEQTNRELRREIVALKREPSATAALREENRRLADTVAEIEMLRRDDFELKRLAEEAAQAKKRVDENDRLARVRAQQRMAETIADPINAELQRLNREGNAMVEEYRALTASSKDPSSTAEERAAAQIAAEQMLEAIKTKQSDIKAFVAAARDGTLNSRPEWSAKLGRWLPQGSEPVDPMPASSDGKSGSRDDRRQFEYRPSK